VCEKVDSAEMREWIGGGRWMSKCVLLRDSSIVEWRRSPGRSRTVQRKVVKRTGPLPLGCFLVRDVCM